MADNFLKLNDPKTEFLLVGSRFRSMVPCSHIQIGDERVAPTTSAKSLGVIFDSGMTMEAHVNSVVRSAFYHIWRIGTIRDYLTHDAAVTLVHAYVSSRLDYCNTLLYGLPDKLIYKIQKAQNAAARLITGTYRYDHITPILFELHWLPVKSRIIFKILLLTFKAYHRLAPVYICDLIAKRPSIHNLRHYDEFLLVNPWTKLKNYGDRAFSKAAPSLWNDLPYDLRSIQNVDCFKQRLKTHLFKLTYQLL